MYADVIAAKQRSFLYTLIIVFLAICLTRTSAFADDNSICAEASGKKSIESCTRLIDAELATGGSIDARKLSNLYFWRGYTHSALEQNKRAISDFTDSIEYNPRQSAAYYQRGTVFYHSKKYQRSLVDFNIAISLESESADNYMARGFNRMRLEQFKRAASDFTKAIELEPNNPAEGYNMRGYAYALSGDVPNGLKDFRQAIALSPKSANYHHSLGDGHFIAGSLEKAREEWKMACQLATADDASDWHKSLKELGYYSGAVEQPCNEKTIKSFELCAQAKCRF